MRLNILFEFKQIRGDSECGTLCHCGHLPHLSHPQNGENRWAARSVVSFPTCTVQGPPSGFFTKCVSCWYCDLCNIFIPVNSSFHLHKFISGSNILSVPKIERKSYYVPKIESSHGDRGQQDKAITFRWEASAWSLPRFLWLNGRQVSVGERMGAPPPLMMGSLSKEGLKENLPEMNFQTLWVNVI